MSSSILQMLPGAGLFMIQTCHPPAENCWEPTSAYANTDMRYGIFSTQKRVLQAAVLLEIDAAVPGLLVDSPTNFFRLDLIHFSIYLLLLCLHRQLDRVSDVRRDLEANPHPSPPSDLDLISKGSAQLNHVENEREHHLSGSCRHLLRGSARREPSIGCRVKVQEIELNILRGDSELRPETGAVPRVIVDSELSWDQSSFHRSCKMPTRSISRLIIGVAVKKRFSRACKSSTAQRMREFVLSRKWTSSQIMSPNQPPNMVPSCLIRSSSVVSSRWRGNF